MRLISRARTVLAKVRTFGVWRFSGALVLALFIFAGSSRLAQADILSSAASGLTNVGATATSWITGLALAPIAYIMLAMSSGFLVIVSLLFNWVIIRTVFQFATYFGSSEGMLTAWGVMRDVSNIALLFSFIFMGILLILNTGGGGHGHGHGINARQAIPRLIIFAVLLNFSLFASQGIIDIANGLSSVFATQAGQKCDGVVDDTCVNKGIAGHIGTRAGISTVFNLGSVVEWAVNPLKFFFTLTMLTIFISTTAIVLLAAAIMLIVRAVVLSFLMITSPIGFAGLVVPGLEKIANDWWHRLIKEAFFAPVYLLLIFISLKITDGLSNGQSLAAAMFDPSVNSVQVVLVFAVVIGFMHMSLVAAKSFGASGATFAIKSASGFVIGGQAFMARRTVGRGATELAEHFRKTEFARSGMGQLVVGGLDKVGASSLDIRATGALKNTGVDHGQAKKGGYVGVLHDREKKQIAYAKTLRKTAEEEKRQEDIDEAISERQKTHDLALAERSQLDQEARAPLAAEIARLQEEENAARRAGDQQRLAIATTARNTAQLQLNALRADQAEAKSTMVADHKQWVDGQEQRKKEIDKDPQRQYADKLGGVPEMLQPIAPLVNLFNNVTVIAKADHHAKDKIKAELKKNDNQKLLDALNANIANQGNAGHGNAPAAAHPPPAAAAGGGHDRH